MGILKNSKNSSGNVLFLILIAVALFAALSYAVTQSTRSGGGDASKETNLVNAATLSQYTASLRTAVQRMVMSGVAVTDLEFNPPSDFANCTSPEVCVFHPDGGGAVYQKAQSSLIDTEGDNPNGQWVYSFNFEVKGIGTSAASSLDGNDLVAILVGIKKDACEQINKRLGISTQPIPSMDSQTFSVELFYTFQDVYVDNDYIMPTAEDELGSVWHGGAALEGKAEGCYWEEEAGNYVYFNVLSER